jgi:hypothetical protein
MSKTKAQLLKEWAVLYDLAVSTDAHRLCDREPTLVFKEQLDRSKEHVDRILRMFEPRTKG